MFADDNERGRRDGADRAGEISVAQRGAGRAIAVDRAAEEEIAPASEFVRPLAAILLAEPALHDRVGNGAEAAFMDGVDPGRPTPGIAQSRSGVAKNERGEPRWVAQREALRDQSTD